MPNPTPQAEWSIEVPSLELTLSLAGEIARQIAAPGTVGFFGGLGCGKTTFIQALGAGLGFRGAITSPTYTIVNRYEGGRLSLVHVDCYRIARESELYEIGLEEVFNGDSLVCIEWAERAQGLLPTDRLEIHLSNTGLFSRDVRMLLRGKIWPGMANKISRWIEESLPR